MKYWKPTSPTLSQLSRPLCKPCPLTMPTHTTPTPHTTPTHYPTHYPHPTHYPTQWPTWRVHQSQVLRAQVHWTQLRHRDSSSWVSWGSWLEGCQATAPGVCWRGGLDHTSSRLRQGHDSSPSCHWSGGPHFSPHCRLFTGKWVSMLVYTVTTVHA